MSPHACEAKEPDTKTTHDRTYYLLTGSQIVPSFSLLIFKPLLAMGYLAIGVYYCTIYYCCELMKLKI